MLSKTSGASIEGLPSLSSAHPFGNSFSAFRYISNLPRVTTVVEASKKNGYGLAGIAKAIGLDPSIALRAKVGTIIASELVNDIPINPSSQAIFA
ncbi:unknown [Coprobacillus sp. CAG:183]|nr:unknown [Coprobacillus sp. CAG:183]